MQTYFDEEREMIFKQKGSEFYPNVDGLQALDFNTLKVVEQNENEEVEKS